MTYYSSDPPYRRLGADTADSIVGMHIENMRLIREVLQYDGGPPNEVELVVGGAGYPQLWRQLYDRLVREEPPTTMIEATPAQMRKLSDALRLYMQPIDTHAQDTHDHTTKPTND